MYAITLQKLQCPGKRWRVLTSRPDWIVTRGGYPRSVPKGQGMDDTMLSFGRSDFGAAVLMTSEHVPDRGKPLHVTRVWVKRSGNWVEILCYQTSVKAAAAIRP